MEQWVWWYWNHGFSIIPVKQNKAPNIDRWEDFQYRRPTENQIQKWLDSKKFQNVGIICGAVSDNLVVIDIDDASIVDELDLNLDKISEYGWVARTGKGYHIYLKDIGNPGGPQRYRRLKLDKCANGSYVVAPPSKHQNTAIYSFMNISKPEDLHPLKERDVGRMWNQIIEQVAHLKGEQVQTPTVFSENGDADCVELIKKGVDEGQRNEAAFALANYYKNIKKLSATEVETLVKKWNTENKPSLPIGEISAVINSAMKPKYKTGCPRIREIGFCPYKTTKECPFINKEIPRKHFSSAPQSLQDVYTRIGKWLFVPDTDRIDVVLAVALSNQYKGLPLWLFIIGSSGDAKSEIVATLDGMPNLIKIDQITPKTLASGAKEGGKKVHDLGEELQNKSTILLFKDLACLTTLKSDDKREIWGQFRTLYDGEINKKTGSGVHTLYKNCHVTIIACMTKLFKQEQLVKEQLGTRELQYEIWANPKHDIEKMKKAMSHRGKEKEMREELRETVQGFLSTKEFDESIVMPADIFDFLLKKCAKLRLLRATAYNDYYSPRAELIGDADAEVTTRVMQQFDVLYCSLKSLDEEYPLEKFKKIIENVVKSSSHPIRYKLYNFFEKKSFEWYNLNQLHSELRIGRKSISGQCEILWNLDYLEKQNREEEVYFGNKWQDVVYYKKKSPLTPAKNDEDWHNKGQLFFK